MLTKEECIKALRGLEILEREENFKKWYQVAPLIKCDVIEQLINEHFDNPPLKWEELKEGMWVWDSIRESYRKVYALDKRIGTKFINFIGVDSIFRENRFYRKQVDE